jgi:hypothetical protein
VAVRALIRYVARHDFNAFAWYRIGLGAMVLWSFQMRSVEFALLGESHRFDSDPVYPPQIGV